MARVRGRKLAEVYANLPILGDSEVHFALTMLQMSVTKDVHRDGHADFGSGLFSADCDVNDFSNLGQRLFEQRNLPGMVKIVLRGSV
jgi:hypothetical protein